MIGQGQDMATVLCVGDSHMRLAGIKPRGALFRYERISPTRIAGFDIAHILSLRGATAAGLRQKSDRTGSYARVARAITRLDPDTVCFGFGQVDAELSCYYMALRDGVSLAEATRAKRGAMPRYLRNCLRLAAGRGLVIKGPNTVTLRGTGALHMMLRANLCPALDLSKQDLSHWLHENDVTLARHGAINVEIATALRRSAHRLGLPYFDLRAAMASADHPGLSQPSFCGRARDVHVQPVMRIETMFGKSLWRSATRERAA